MLTPLSWCAGVILSHGLMQDLRMQFFERCVQSDQSAGMSCVVMWHRVWRVSRLVLCCISAWHGSNVRLELKTSYSKAFAYEQV